MMLLPAITTASLLLTTAPAKFQQEVEPSDLAPLLETVLAEFDVPGVGGAIVTSQGLAALGVAGVRERGSSTQILPGDRFHIGSCTKAMTATLVGRAVERKELRWDMTLLEALPALNDTMHEDWRSVTLAQILSHTAGMPNNLRDHTDLLPTYMSKTRPMPEVRYEVVEGILGQPPASEPGKKFAYSNLGYVLTGAILEHLEQKPWEEVIREQLFTPLGMTSAGFGGPDAPYFAEAPDVVDASEPPQPRGHFENGKVAVAFDNAPILGPAGTVHCTLGDWAKFARLHLEGDRGEEGLLLEPATIAALHTSAPGTLHLRNWRKTGYGGGWVVTTRSWAGGRVLMHDGSNTAWFAYLWIVPEDDCALLVCCNQGGPTGRKASESSAEKLIDFLKQHRAAEADETSTESVVRSQDNSTTIWPQRCKPWWSCPDSVPLRFSTKYFRMLEEQDPPSVMPDELVQLSSDDWLRGNDPVLERALQR